MAEEREALELLVQRFAEALLLKLVQAEAKHGWNGAWRRDDWSGELPAELLRHVGKGDPLDVAAYCAFAWHHGWPIAGPHAAEAIEIVALIDALRAEEGDDVRILCDNPEPPPNVAIECNGGWTNYDNRRFEGDTLIQCLRAAQSALFAWRQQAAEA